MQGLYVIYALGNLRYLDRNPLNSKRVKQETLGLHCSPRKKFESINTAAQAVIIP